MRTFICLAIMTIVCASPALDAIARIQPDMLCWEPDVEFPVPCEDEDG